MSALSTVNCSQYIGKVVSYFLLKVLHCYWCIYNGLCSEVRTRYVWYAYCSIQCNRRLIVFTQDMCCLPCIPHGCNYTTLAHYLPSTLPKATLTQHLHHYLLLTYSNLAVVISIMATLHICIAPKNITGNAISGTKPVGNTFCLSMTT